MSFSFLQHSVQAVVASSDRVQAQELLETLHQQPLPEEYWPTKVRANPTQLSSFAVSFDIDGVLLQGKHCLPNASESITLLQRLAVPFIFLTNGGGMSEKAHTQRLANRLSVCLDTRQFIQSHTPFLDLIPRLQEKNVLVLGGEQSNNIREVAEGYGFKNVITASDLAAANPSIFPFSEISQEHHNKLAKPLPAGPLVIDAITVWSSPRDWGLDLQLCRDLLLSDGGLLGSISKTAGDATLHNHGFQSDTPELFFCNPDHLWPTDYKGADGQPQLRFAQGAFKAALEGIWSVETNGKAPLISRTVGKPEHETFAYANNKLQAYQKVFHGAGAPDIGSIWMFDDNPASGILGANRYERGWKSVLLETGVHVAGTVPSVQPTSIQRDVKTAMGYAFQQEGWSLPEEAWVWATKLTQAIKKLQNVLNSPSNPQSL
ncbi:hypothetical protein BP6252_07824 [Coleophoma cylindrospora]|uniref:HAD-superfamily hydrolase n=1 Tax=Coleophoma cylindrospora TaxID=1849047 RepID=A0A3D8RBK7_9HELO|nr:hypothetical protein BP6252_07824 [Coleophoma cylindrospora]